MENIGKQLKEARLAQKMTLEHVMSITKYTKAQIVAIENGNIDYFKGDLSYLSYYVRYLAKAVNVDYELLREDVERITNGKDNSEEIDQIRKKVNIKENVRNQTQKSNPNIKKKKHKKIDYSFIVFLVSSILMIVFLLYLGIKHVPGWFKSDPIDKPPVVYPKPETPAEPETPETPDDEVSTLKITTKDPTHIEVSNWDDEAEVEITLKFKAAQTWISTSVNNAALAEPASKTYYKDEEIVVKEKMTENKEVMFHMGVMAGNEFYINGEKVLLEESIQDSRGVVKLYFKFVKDGEPN